MNKLLNNLLGMYKQAKLNKKAEEDLIEVGWGLFTNDEYEIKDNALYGDDKPQEVNETFWNKINNEIDKVESWFLKEGYKKFFTKVRDEGHGKDSELGGTAWMTENQLKDFMANAEQWDTEFVLAESSGTLDFGNIPVDYNEALSFKLKIDVDDKDLDELGDELGIESKRVSKNKKLSSKNTKLTKKAGIPDVYKNNAIVKRIEEMLAKMDMKIKSIEGKGLDYKKVNTDSMMPGSSSFSGSSFKEILNKVNEYFKTSRYNKQSSNSKAKAVRKQAKYEETVQGDEKVKDSAKSFGYDIKFAGHYGRWIYYYLIDEKGNIIRDDKEYQKVYDEMKKRIDDDIDIRNYDFAKALIEEVDGKLMRIPTIVVSEGSLLINHKDRKQATKKKAVLQESENGLGYVLPNGQVVYPGDEEYLKSEKRANERMLEEDKKELERLESIIKKYPDINFDKNPDSVKFQIPRVKKGIEYLQLFNETIEDILNAFKNKKMGKQATIKHENGVYNVYSESGKCLGKGYKTKEEAEKRLKQVEYFKHKSSLKQVVISKMAKIKK